MSLRFNLVQNTPTDWTKAITTAATVAVAGYSAAAATDGVSPGEWVGLVVSVVVAFATALGVYHSSAVDTSQVPEDTEPVTFQVDNSPSTLPSTADPTETVQEAS